MGERIDDANMLLVEATIRNGEEVVFVIGNLILGILNLQPNGTISTVELIGWFPVLFITFVASIFVLLRVPALTNHIFSGTSGGSSTGILEGVFK